jgi:hypothetical protein
MSEQPEALRLFTHELLDYEGKPNGVHVGCNNLAVCKQSYVEGETSTAIYEWVDAAELRRLHAVNAELLEALKWIDRRCPKHLLDSDPHKIHRETAYDAGASARAAIAKATEVKP